MTDEPSPETPPSVEPPVVGWTLPPPPTRAPAALGDGWDIAGTGARVFAYLFDGILLSSVSIIVAVLFGAYDAGRSTEAISIRVTAAALMTLLFDAMYFITTWRMTGHATLGMRLLRIRVVRLEDGGTLSLRAAFVRWFALSGALSLVTLLPGTGGSGIFLALGYALALLLTTNSHPLHQGWHDRWAGSVVARAAGAGNAVAIVGCLFLIAIFTIVPFILLAAAGPGLQDMLERIGRSV